MKLECDVIRDLLPLYAEKLASPASSALVEQHLSECPACRAELEQMEKPVPEQPEPQPQEEPISPAQPVENPLPAEPEEPQSWAFFGLCSVWAAQKRR